MTNAQSKLLPQVHVSCKDFIHPWTNSCLNASAGLLLAATPYCLRVYTVVHALSLLMKYRRPTMLDLQRTLQGIIQSTAFLVTNSFTFILYNCMLRKLLGHYNPLTAAFVPSFLASWTAILVERPARRPLLTLYVANVATEAIWNMAVSHGIVSPLPHGQTMIFALSVSTLLYIYRLGLHRTHCKDSIFNILRLFVGKAEEGPLPLNAEEQNLHNHLQEPIPFSFRNMSSLAQMYAGFLQRLRSKHQSCTHKETCLKYCLRGGMKPLIGGIALQVSLKVVMNFGKIVQGRMKWRQRLFNRHTLAMGTFMGSFSLLYKGVSCILRHSFGRDDPLFALPAGLLAGTTFSLYPDTTVALYVMWKTLQILYNYGVTKGKLPVVPGFMLFLYSFCTATLLHSGTLEPKYLRPSYYKFLYAISGDRLSKFQCEPFEAFGYQTAQSVREVMKHLNIAQTATLPRFALVS